MSPAAGEFAIPVKICFEPGSLEIPIDQECPQSFLVKNFADVRQSHRAPDAALEGIERVNHGYAPNATSGLSSDFLRCKW
jgi:hypothetical protein